MSLDGAVREAANISTDFLKGGGEMGELIRSFDWSKTTIGPIETWSPSLRMMVSFLLVNRFPLLLWWGPNYVSIYNDAYIPILGRKHPAALGQPVSECWHEIWNVLQPLIDTPFHGGPPTWMEDLELHIRRKGFTEEGHFTVAYSPVPDETVSSGIGGVLATVHETTEKVVAERRVNILRQLAVRAGDAKTVGEACSTAATTLTDHAKDIPFTLLYVLEAQTLTALLSATAGVDSGTVISPLAIDLNTDGEQLWPLAEVNRSEDMQVVENLLTRFSMVPAGPWVDPPHTAVIMPIRSNVTHQLAGFLVAGISSRLQLDEQYRSFLELAATQIATSIANARAYEEERNRAEALAEIDRAKTAFFSNVSHEFRTPLTLLLGPLQESLSSKDDLPVSISQNLSIAHRNGLRLQKLVNTLLDFSRIEAGRVEAAYEPIDLAAITTDLASNFRSATEKAGLRFTVDCPPLPEPIFMDPDMWEKVVLNLLSNAFKHTFHGEIAVRLVWRGERVDLIVSDTGTGIAAADLPHIFKRFHRIRGARTRTHEGTGIGLALVQELVMLHGGTIHVESEVNRGTTFTVSIPRGNVHLPTDRIGIASTLQSTPINSEAFVEEALGWLPDDSAETKTQQYRNNEGIQTSEPKRADASSSAAPLGRPRILLADDNADMRDYVRRLLGQTYQVQVVPDGAAALQEARRNPPDLVLTDAMMPGLDGFELLRELRNDERLKSIPVIFLSARAGEESRLEGIEAGADDYLVKPFSARELLARVSGRLELARLHTRLNEERALLGTLFFQSPVPVAVLEGPDLIFQMANRAYVQALGGRDVLGKPLVEVLPEFHSQGFDDLLRGVMQTGVAHVGHETLLRLHRSPNFELEDTYWTFICAPFRNANRQDDCVIAICTEVTEQVKGRQRLEQLAAQLSNELAERKRAEGAMSHLAAIVENSDDAIVSKDLNGIITSWNQGAERVFGYTASEMIGKPISLLAPAERLNEMPEILDRVKRNQHVHYETLRRRKDGRTIPISLTVSPILDSAGRIIGASKIARDITDRKRAEDERALLLSREHDARTTAETLNRVAPMILRELDPARLVQGVTDIATKLIAAEFGAFFRNVVNEQDEPYMLYALSGTLRETFADFPLPRKTALFESTFRGEGVIRSDDITQDPRYGKSAPDDGMPEGYFPVRSYLAVPVTSRTGEVLGGLFFGHSALGKFTDAHEAIIVGIAAQAAIAMDNARLFERAGWAQTELKRMNEELHRANHDLETFAYSASHDLREPLRTMAISAQLLDRRCGDRLPPKEAVLLERILDGAKRMATLIDDLLSYLGVAKAAEGQPPTVESGNVLASVLADLKASIEQAGAVVTHGQLPLVNIHEIRLAQLFQNLISNAIKYNRSGIPSVHISAHEREGWCMFSVADNGIGVDRQYANQIFEPFRRLHNREEYSGSGIGLGICQRIIEHYGGRIWLEKSTPGEGSTFCFTIPTGSR